MRKIAIIEKRTLIFTEDQLDILFNNEYEGERIWENAPMALRQELIDDPGVIYEFEDEAWEIKTELTGVEVLGDELS